MSPRINIGQELRNEMIRQNLSVRKVAKEFNIDRNCIYRIFNKKSIDTDRLYQFSVMLKRDFFKLYSDNLEDNTAA